MPRLKRKKKTCCNYFSYATKKNYKLRYVLSRLNGNIYNQENVRSTKDKQFSGLEFVSETSNYAKTAYLA